MRTMYAPVAIGLLLMLFSFVEADIINVPADQATIQAAVDIANPGDEIVLAVGLFSEIVDIDGKSDLIIRSVDQAQPSMIKPNSANAWAVGGYGTTRWAGIRIVNSTGITFSYIDFDFDLIKANTVTGMLVWDSEALVSHCSLANMSASDAGGQYTEITCYVRAPGYTSSARATVRFASCSFSETGRIGIVAHDYIHLEVDNCTFEKTIPDFGYAMEIGSEASGLVQDCVISGYNTPAASDGSISSGILVENSFTTDAGGFSKTVDLFRNFIYNCQWGLYFGNGHDGFAGDVDIIVNLTENFIFGNVVGAYAATDEDAEDGSSLTINSSLNDITGNLNGAYLFTRGDGNLTVHMTGDTIEGHEDGVTLYDNTPSSSSVYDIVISDSYIIDNWSHGVNNRHGVTVIDARDNWWGDSSGPAGFGPGTGDAITDNVLFVPWVGYVPSCCGEFTGGYPGNADCDGGGKRNLADITRLIDNVYISKVALCCPANGNTFPDSEGRVNLADITALIDFVYISKQELTACPEFSSRGGVTTLSDLSDRTLNDKPVTELLTEAIKLSPWQ